ncbi:MAG: hypothetical protein JW821_15140, partial [Deltaproteobacteria bacterium]|nr:hypothetical protein [Deltaproteobacteria bacterium]
VASNVAGHRDVLREETALLVPGRGVLDINQGGRVSARWDDPDLDALIERLDWAYHHREEIREMGERAARAMAGFTWERTARSFLAVLEELL